MNLRELLSYLPIDTLTDAIGASVADGLAEMGMSSERAAMAEVLAKTQGKQSLDRKPIRQLLSVSRGALDFMNWDEDKRKSFVLGKRTEIEELYAALGLPPGLNQRIEKVASAELFAPEMYPYPYQNWVRLRAVEQIRQLPNGKMLIHMPTGAGKTVTAMSIIVDVFRDNIPNPIDIVWIAHTNELCEQAVFTFQNWWKAQGIGEVKVHRLWGKHTDFAQIDASVSNFFVTSFQSAYSYTVTDSDPIYKAINRIGRSSKLVVVDEAHLAIAPTYQLAVDTLARNNAAVLGLSATPGRHSALERADETKKLHQYFDNNILPFPDDDGNPVENPIKFLQDRGTLSKVILSRIKGVKSELTEDELQKCSDQLELPLEVLARIARDPDRTHLVASHVMEEAVKGSKILVFCPSKDNAVILAQFLATKGLTSRAVTGDMSAEDRSQAIKLFKSGDIQVITNFNVLTTGFDDPKIDCVVLARPTLSIVLYAQMIGRGMRGPGAGGTKNCKAYIIEDNIENLPTIESASTYFTEDYFE